jgi:hypothetical protein
MDVVPECPVVPGSFLSAKHVFLRVSPFGGLSHSLVDYFRFHVNEYTTREALFLAAKENLGVSGCCVEV